MIPWYSAYLCIHFILHVTCSAGATFEILNSHGKKTSSHSSSKTQKLKWEACGCTMCVCVCVCVSCYELRAVVQSGIGGWPWGIMFFSGTALVLLTVLMMACTHKVFTASSTVRTYMHSHPECFLKNKKATVAQKLQRLSTKQKCTPTDDQVNMLPSNKYTYTHSPL